ncbi:Uncharacterised protein [Segatella copri]|nr:Uncharacterised protein [Segatella copri]
MLHLFRNQQSFLLFLKQRMDCNIFPLVHQPFAQWLLSLGYQSRPYQECSPKRLSWLCKLRCWQEPAP